VRALVRENRIDPGLNADAVDALARTVVEDHDRRSLTGAVDPIEHPELVVRQIVADVSGLGPLQPLIDDPSVEEIWINEPDRVFIARDGRPELTSIILTANQVRELIERMLSSSGRRLDVSRPFVDATLPGGHRLHVVLQGISREFAAVNIRKYVAKADNLADLADVGTLDIDAADFLTKAVADGTNIIVSGGTQAGKTTMLNCLTAAVPGTQRLVSAEEVFELKCAHPDWVALQTRQAGLEGTGEITLRDLVREALRMRPSRLIIGEVRGPECLDLLLALNSGLPGMATIHASSARQALVKLCTLPLLAAENIGAAFVVPTVASCVGLVVHLTLGRDGTRRVAEIIAVTGRVENSVIETETVYVRAGGQVIQPPVLDDGRNGLPWEA
jgi:pilus assembly protein CpaF